jgi:hypothetical protein
MVASQSPFSRDRCTFKAGARRSRAQGRQSIFNHDHLPEIAAARRRWK